MAEEMPHWMKRFIQQELNEEKEPLVKLLGPKARHFIWWLCKEYSFMYNGVMGQSCSLLERYMAKKSLTFFYTAPRMLAKRPRVNHNLSSRIPLLASVCIALTAKMMTSEILISASTIRNLLLLLNMDVTLAMINEAEADVLTTVDFILPMFTNVEKAMLMALDVGLKSGSILEGITLVTDIAEYYRSDIQQEVINVAFSFHTDKDDTIMRHAITNVRHIHLVAGVVVATKLYFENTGPDPVPRLCFLTQSTSLFINCIGNIIHKRLITPYGTEPSYEDPSCGEPSTSKRKRTED